MGQARGSVARSEWLRQGQKRDSGLSGNQMKVEKLSDTNNRE